MSTIVIGEFDSFHVGHRYLVRAAKRIAERQLRAPVARSRIELVEVERARDNGGQPITSDLVRRQLAAGDVAHVACLLGSKFGVTGVVQHGDARGRTIGFPTANLCQDNATAWPAFGVYAAWVTVGDESHRAAVNIGTRPTVYGTSGVKLLEAHLLDFDEDLYDRVITVQFVDRIRGEQRFESLDALKSRLATDVSVTRRLLQIPGA